MIELCGALQSISPHFKGTTILGCSIASLVRWYTYFFLFLKYQNFRLRNHNIANITLLMGEHSRDPNSSWWQLHAGCHTHTGAQTQLLLVDNTSRVSYVYIISAWKFKVMYITDKASRTIPKMTTIQQCHTKNLGLVRTDDGQGHPWWRSSSIHIK